MALNSSSGSWSVKVFNIPKSITFVQLAEEMGLSQSRIYIPRSPNIDIPYAWVNNFADEEEAHDFARHWSDSSIMDKRITCDVFERKSDQTNDLHPSRDSTDADSKKRYEPRRFIESKKQTDNVNRENSPVPLISTLTTKPCNTATNINKEENPVTVRQTDRYPSQQYYQSNQISKPVNTSGSPSTAPKYSAKSQIAEDKRPLCQLANRGACREKSNECRYRHKRCEDYTSCSNSNCELAHAQKDTFAESLASPFTIHKPMPVLRSPNYPRSDSRSSTSSLQSMTSKQSTSLKGKACRSGIKCFNVDCEFNHPNGWYACTNGIECEDYECTANHPPKRKGKCRDGNACRNSKCRFLHPKSNRHRSDSSSSDSSLQSRSVRKKACRNGMKCFNVDCKYDHPEGWNACVKGTECEDNECTANHPPKRKVKCQYDNDCRNSKCKFLHSSRRVEECAFGAKCKKWSCQKIHPLSRPRLCTKEENCTDLACLCIHPPQHARLLCSAAADCRDVC